MGGTEWAKFGLGIDWTCVNMQAVLPDPATRIACGKHLANGPLPARTGAHRELKLIRNDELSEFRS